MFSNKTSHKISQSTWWFPTCYFHAFWKGFIMITLGYFVRVNNQQLLCLTTFSNLFIISTNLPDYTNAILHSDWLRYILYDHPLLFSGWRLSAKKGHFFSSHRSFRRGFRNIKWIIKLSRRLSETRPFAVTALEILEKKTDNRSDKAERWTQKTVHFALNNTMVTF